MRRLFIFFLIIGCLFVCVPADRRRAEAIFFDVGQGDAFALRTPQGKIIVVDGGPDWSSLSGLGKWLGFGQRQIDFLILSHGHDDHLAALPELAARFHIKSAVLPPRLSGSTAAALIETLQVDGTALKYPTTAFCLALETNCSLCIFPPETSFLKTDDENDLSLALHFDCSGLSVTTTGDASQKRERDFIASGFDWSASVFKASHHGSASANSSAFLQNVKPAFMVFSVGQDNKYGHPAPEVINRAESEKIKIWRTDQSGAILFYSNNSKIYFKKMD